MRLIMMLLMMCAAVNMSGRSLASRMEDAGLVDVSVIEPRVVVDLMYAREDNFTGVKLYTDGLDRAYLHPKAAEGVRLAQEALEREVPGLRLKICDAARPMSVQRRMYEVVRGTSKARYVSNPANGGGLHNYGMAVDITISDSLGNELPMGTPVDHLGPEANIDREKDLVAKGVITDVEMANRELLRRVMAAGGFRPLRSEWWHFNLCTRATARRLYRRLDF